MLDENSAFPMGGTKIGSKYLNGKTKYPFHAVIRCCGSTGLQPYVTQWIADTYGLLRLMELPNVEAGNDKWFL